jgi:cyclohexa-1,5-dienecarbonyl-CoA hydratase
LVSCCDLVVASELARFGQPEIKLGVIAPVAALRLPRQIGGRRAAELLMMGTTLDATDAFEMGLINRLVPADQFEATVEVIINELTSLSAAALRACKRAVRLGTDEWVGLKAVERLYLEELMATQDAQEGLAAFLEKRPPVWTDR